MHDYEFRPCRPEEAAEVFRLIRARTRWMDEVGIRQWNHTDYLNVFPLSYYEEQQAEGTLYVLCERQTGKLAAAAVLLTEDERWQGDVAPALYIHNLVGAPDCPGAGKEFLRRTEEMALRMGKRYLRLDSTRDNEALTAYYERCGFQPAGECALGAYEGTLRQKPLAS